MLSLRPYQEEISLAVMRSFMAREGLTFCVEIARQGGKNTLSADLELQILLLSADKPLNLVKCSPTFKPQTVVSMQRLKERLNESFSGRWKTEHGYILKVDEARAIFLSADRSANVVGHTAHLLLEVDEAQDVGKEKYTKEFKPMAATTNATTVLYGTTWDDSTLLEETRQSCLEQEKRDGIRRCFRFDWEEVARHNDDYRAYVESERERLGENHPLFLTQYRLLPVRGGGGFLSSAQRAQLQGEHGRQHRPEPGKIYLAGVDLAGEAEEEEGAYLKTLDSRQDSTVITIGEVGFTSVGLQKQPHVRIVEQYRWVGVKHTELYPRLVDILKNLWRCRRVVIDATGVGQPVSSFLKQAVGAAVVPFVFTARSKSELGFNLLASVNSGSLKMYRGDGSEEYKQFWLQMEQASSYYRASRTMNFYVEPSRGHDDFLMSLALLVEASNRYQPRGARGRDAE